MPENNNTRPESPLVGLDEKEVIDCIWMDGILQEKSKYMVMKGFFETPIDELNFFEEVSDRIAKSICAKFGSPQKVHSCRCRTGQKGAMTVKRIDDGLFECPRCGGIIVPKPDHRFVEVGKIVWPEEMVHFANCKMGTFGEDGCTCGATMKNRTIDACKAAVEKAKGQPHDAD